MMENFPVEWAQENHSTEDYFTYDKKLTEILISCNPIPSHQIITFFAHTSTALLCLGTEELLWNVQKN